MWMPSLLALLLLSAAARPCSAQESDANTDMEWDESTDKLLAAYLADQITVNEHRLLVSPWPADDGSTNKWKWVKPDDMSYTFTPSKKIPWLGEEGTTKTGVETAESMIGILEFDDKDNHQDVMELYKQFMAQKAFRRVYFDQVINIFQGLPIGRSNIPSPDINDFNPFDIDNLAGYREQVIEAVNKFRTGSFSVTPNDTQYRKLWNIRQVRGDYTLRDDLPTTGQGAVVAVLDTG
eukprot:CAMPEP_0117664994 /NCGR_PEP_ID=MMETSP0804-20121206/9551_1 /TAXON_ID=1074897 /ORGANISM="Tetraselmis astigmatica, Strain CCMP880" /LENGTH=235 /DNA_ID=CAMNT_0005472333 /DNA_START=234 /DNA_END=937 /DNA_ORIENTATION=-